MDGTTARDENRRTERERSWPKTDWSIERGVKDEGDSRPVRLDIRRSKTTRRGKLLKNRALITYVSLINGRNERRVRKAEASTTSNSISSFIRSARYYEWKVKNRGAGAPCPGTLMKRQIEFAGERSQGNVRKRSMTKQRNVYMYIYSTTFRVCMVGCISNSS